MDIKKQDLERYKQSLADIERWIEANKEYEHISKILYYDIPRLGGSLEALIPYAIRKYNKIAMKVSYHGYNGVEAFYEAREDLRMFKIAIKNLS
jgi:hypothetical protein